MVPLEFLVAETGELEIVAKVEGLDGSCATFGRSFFWISSRTSPKFSVVTSMLILISRINAT